VDIISTGEHDFQKVKGLFLVGEDILERDRVVHGAITYEVKNVRTTSDGHHKETVLERIVT